jgi:hypothetical protein
LSAAVLSQACVLLPSNDDASPVAHCCQSSCSATKLIVFLALHVTHCFDTNTVVPAEGTQRSIRAIIIINNIIIHV